jgi:putative CocE/NonD family hydrolase
MKTRQERVKYKRGYLYIPMGAALLLFLFILGPWAVVSMRAAQRESLYVEMRDGVRIAIDVWLPKSLEKGQRIPTILRATCYWRSYQYGALGQIMEALGILPYDQQEGKHWTDAGYALVVMDVRGSGASSGRWEVIWSQEEIADMGEVVDWIVAQPWSNGKVGSYGVSYDGNMAEMLARLQHPAVKAVAPQYFDFDLYALVRPGGVLNRGFMEGWSDFHNRLVMNDVCAFVAAAQVDCEQIKSMMKGVRPVDGDPDGVQLAASVAEHAHVDVHRIAREIEYRDDTWLSTGVTLGEVSPHSWKEDIEGSGVPIFAWASWLDSGIVDGVLAQYLTFRNPQTLIIGPWSHGGSYHADPFLPADAKVTLSLEEQFQMLVDFFDAYLKDGDHPAPESGIRYYTLGEGKWKTSQTWPPEGSSMQRWYLAPGNSVALQPPEVETTEDEYRVDWSTTTGESNRWFTSLFKEDVIYPDRAQEDAKLLTYTSQPVETDIEITGNPAVTLYLSTSESDGAVHVYLEDVAPDGRVTYITEGILRLANRAVKDSQGAYDPFAPYRSMERADAQPMEPGQVTEISLRLFATSVRISQGHRIRIAIAGGDASTFARVPEQGNPVFTIYRNIPYPSFIDLPVMGK